jgi:uroporphyrinogen-III decarboxylase
MTLKENVIRAFNHKETLWTPNVYTDFDLVLQSTVNERYEGKESGTDDFGVSFTYVPEADAPVVTPGTFILTDITRWKEQVTFPDVEAYDWKAGALRDTAEWDRKNRFSVVMMYNGPFERLHALMGFEDALVALLTEPEYVSEFFASFVEYRIKLVQKIAQFYRPDAIMVFDDYGTATGMMMSPDVWRKLIKPHLKRLIDAAHRYGLYYILHSCGYIKPIFSDIVEMGADAVHPMQYFNDVLELKKQYGKHITFTGGFRAIETFDNPMSSEEEMRAEVRRVLKELAHGGSYIAWQTILNKQSKKVFLDEIMKDSVPKMIAANVTPPDWEKVIL